MTTSTSTTALLSRPNYERMKFVVQILLPGLATFYLTISPLWGLPRAMEIAATITALNLLLGLFLTYDKHRYEASGEGVDGEWVVDREDGIPMKMKAELKPEARENIQDLAEKKYVTFKVTDGENLSV